MLLLSKVALGGAWLLMIGGKRGRTCAAGLLEALRLVNHVQAVCHATCWGGEDMFMCRAGRHATIIRSCIREFCIKCTRHAHDMHTASSPHIGEAPKRTPFRWPVRLGPPASLQFTDAANLSLATAKAETCRLWDDAAKSYCRSKRCSAHDT